MECRRKNLVLLHQRRFAGEVRQDFHPGADVFDNRRADKYHFHRSGFQLGAANGNIACELPAIGISQECHVYKPKRFLRGIVHLRSEQDGACAGAENRLILCCEFFYRIEESFFFQELQLCGGFPAGKNERVAIFQVRDRAHFYSFSPQRLQHRGMGGKIALYSQDSDFWCRVLCHSFDDPVCE